MPKQSAKKTAKKVVNKVKETELSTNQKVGLGIGLTAAAVAAAGAYFLYGSEEAPKNRKKVKSWALKAKSEVLDTLEKAEHMTEEEFKGLVNNVASMYEKAQSVGKTELSSFKKEMLSDWKSLVASGAVKVLTAEQVARRVAKKTAKKEINNKVKASAKKGSASKKKTTKKTATKKSATKKS